MFNPKEVPLIKPGDATWTVVKAWADMNLARLRSEREKESVDLRKLDQSLGGIIAMEALLALPEQIKQERSRTPVPDTMFGIPPIT